MNDSTVDRNTPKGTMFLYEQPELLTTETHGKLGLNNNERPYEFTRSIMSVPLVAAEIYSAQKTYPVIFSDLTTATPLAVLSVIQGENMFVDANGQWETLSYIPSYLRRHPFAFAEDSEDQFAVVIDRASREISEAAEFPFFEDNQLTPHIQKRIDFCLQFEKERRRSAEFSKTLIELDLLTLQELTPNGDANAKSLATYYAVDGHRLNALKPDVLANLHTQGFLSFIFAHLFSLENWNRLLQRRNLAMTSKKRAHN